MLLINKLLIVIIILLIVLLVTQGYIIYNNLLKLEKFETKPIVTEKGKILYDPNPEHDTVYHDDIDDVISDTELKKIQGNQTIYDLGDTEDNNIISDNNDTTISLEEDQYKFSYPEEEEPLNYKKTDRIEDATSQNNIVEGFSPYCASYPINNIE